MPRMSHQPIRRRSVLISLLGLLAIIIFVPNAAQAVGCPIPNFKSALVTDAQQRASAFVAADFNHDNKLDIAIAKDGPSFTSTGAVSIRLGNGDGTFGAPTTITIGGVVLRSIEIGRFNNDTELDLIVTNYDTNEVNYRASILYGNGAGGFGPRPAGDPEAPVSARRLSRLRRRAR